MKFLVKIAALLGVLAGYGAAAAELPTMKPRPPAPARRCEIGGMVGVLSVNGVCLKIGGYVSSSFQAGNIKSPAAPLGGSQP